ncbi:hypothetical protein [Saccharibacillus alkalitolerans]|uniref:Uncharacterized protein n=1 Tax=Saccharibacillus alkalitolerans TaxID=2705290 RepID=A0ABX0F6X6_9BACL|nr:hypothetical protein [Saccharibacillus alkalitolerans]NGZ76716.1 hypothetical protein [Saccharibacillus alkalitolerans]
MFLLIGVFLLLCPLVIARPDRLVHPLRDPAGEDAAEPVRFQSEAFRALGFLLLFVSLSLGVMMMLSGG